MKKMKYQRASLFSHLKWLKIKNKKQKQPNNNKPVRNDFRAGDVTSGRVPV
jgi:hypothetical protein